jgi:hypothetical protein
MNLDIERVKEKVRKIAQELGKKEVLAVGLLLARNEREPKVTGVVPCKLG